MSKGKAKQSKATLGESRNRHQGGAKARESSQEHSPYAMAPQKPFVHWVAVVSSEEVRRMRILQNEWLWYVHTNIS